MDVPVNPQIGSFTLKGESFIGTNENGSYVFSTLDITREAFVNAELKSTFLRYDIYKTYLESFILLIHHKTKHYYPQC